MSNTLVRVGLPQALFHHSYGGFWETFFRALGVEVVLSGDTTREMLDNGVKEAVNELCVPVKIYHGHVRSLATRSDAIFVPRYVNAGAKTVFCPKFLGLPEMIRFSMKNIPPLISPRIDMRRGRLELGRVCAQVACELGVPRWRGVAAWVAALRSQGSHGRGSKPGVDSGGSASAGRIRLAVLGYPYEVYDGFLNIDLLPRLTRLGADVVTMESLPRDLPAPGWLVKKLFWHYSDRVARAASYCLEDGRVDGMIHVTVFGCGPDAMTGRIIEMEASRRGVPFMDLLLDEHSGEAGVVTRLEAFIDMIRRTRSLDDGPGPGERKA